MFSEYKRITQSATVRRHRIAAWPAMLAVLFAAGCSSDLDDGPPQPTADSSGAIPIVAPPPPVIPVSERVQGYFYGNISVEDDSLRAEAVISADGDVRLFLFDPAASDGETADGAPQKDERMQFFGRLQLADDGLSGSGLVTGEVCVPTRRSRFCGEPAPAFARFTLMPGFALAGEIDVTVGDAVETWWLQLDKWRWYSVYSPDTLPSGIYHGAFVRVSDQQELIVDIDRDGRLFFQDAMSGCTGNGSVRSRENGAGIVFDIDFSVAACAAPFEDLNTDYSGLAATILDGWDLEFEAMIVSVSARDAPAAPATMTWYVYEP